MLKGLFINSPKAQCSIHESGKMIYDALCLSSAYEIDYLEITKDDRIYNDMYDFVAFNYHPYTMPWVDTTKIRNLPGLKVTFVLEALPHDPFPLCPHDDFDAYCVLDPTMDIDMHNVYPFPRPLEIPPLVLGPVPEIPTIGTFGFATPGKGFEQVVKAVGNEFDEAIVKINMPSGTYIGKREHIYAQRIERTCHAMAREGISLQITHDYMTKNQLIQWCSKNTLNCFLYTRNQPGLSATTDQAISSGRPLAVSSNETFRHILRYIEPYPKWTLRDSIEKSVPGVLMMQHHWTPLQFALMFEVVLRKQLVKHYKTGNQFSIPKKGMVSTVFGKCMTITKFLKNELSPRKATGNRNILFVSHKDKQCGIHQYGLDTAEALRNSMNFNYYYCECDNKHELAEEVKMIQPEAIIYNYYPATMPWLTRSVTKKYGKSFGIMHEVTQEAYEKADRSLFDYHLCPDPTVWPREYPFDYIYIIPRLIQSYPMRYMKPEIPTIGSFGFGFLDKGFETIVEHVITEFDEAVIRFHIPDALDIVDKDGAMKKETTKNCRDLVRGTGIKLVITEQFLPKGKLLDFLAGNSINAFFYETSKHKGLSSVIDYALAVDVPLAINKCGMFRHIYDATPSICIENTTLKEIIENGTLPLQEYKEQWSQKNFVGTYDRLMERILCH